MTITVYERPILQGVSDSLSVGIDLTEVNRFRRLGLDAPFYSRVYTPSEIEYCLKYSDPYPHLAAIFAAKEAVLKSMSNPNELSFDEIEISHDSNGAPYAQVQRQHSREFLISLSHSQDHAIAIAISITSDLTVEVSSLRATLLSSIENTLPKVIEEHEQKC